MEDFILSPAPWKYKPRERREAEWYVSEPLYKVKQLREEYLKKKASDDGEQISECLR